MSTEHRPTVIHISDLSTDLLKVNREKRHPCKTNLWTSNTHHKVWRLKVLTSLWGN